MKYLNVTAFGHPGAAAVSLPRTVGAWAPVFGLLLALASLPWSAGAQVTRTNVPHLADIRAHRCTLTATGPGAFTWEETLEAEVYSVEGARLFQTLSEYYDDASEVSDMEAQVWSAGEKKPEVLRKKDRRDYAPTDMTTVASDGRVATMSLPLPTAYPAVIRTRTLRAVKESVWLPTTVFRYPAGVTVELATLTLAGDRSTVLTKVIDPESLLTVTEANGAVEYKIEGVSLSAKREDFAPSSTRVGPAVLLAPRTGSLGGTKGDFTTWSGMGTWTAGLLADRSTLPAAAVEEVRALVAGIADPRTRVERVYAYMQARTHYVSIQLGIGGFKPMDPASVHALGYGDCKALSNYTRLLLAAADIPANYCIIGAADAEIFLPEFASTSQANHAILAVPLAQDTMWLECTSQTDPAGLCLGGLDGGPLRPLGQRRQRPTGPHERRRRPRQFRELLHDRRSHYRLRGALLAAEHFPGHATRAARRIAQGKPRRPPEDCPKSARAYARRSRPPNQSGEFGEWSGRDGAGGGSATGLPPDGRQAARAVDVRVSPGTPGPAGHGAAREPGPAPGRVRAGGHAGAGFAERRPSQWPRRAHRGQRSAGQLHALDPGE